MKYLWIALIIVVIGGGLVAATMLKPITQTTPASSETKDKVADNEPNDTDTQEDPQAEPAIDTDQEVALADGRYVDYKSSLVSSEGYEETILFFHAPWCPECRAFEEAIESSAIPDGVQVLKVDYDDNDALKATYEVTLQSTFVSVDDDGERVSKWVGYGKDKSIDAILENT